MQSKNFEEDSHSSNDIVHQPSRSCCCCCCAGADMDVERLVDFDGHTDPINRISNAVNNQKYNVLNFLPVVLFNQFKLFFNFFQLAINLSQLIPILKVGRFYFNYRLLIYVFIPFSYGHDINIRKGGI